MGIPLFILLLAACPPKHGGNEDLVYQLDKEVIALKQKVEWLEAQKGDCQGAGKPAPIYAELVQIMPATETEVTRKGAITLVSIPVSKLFASGSFRLRRETTMVLDLLATAINLHPTSPVEIVGYTDDSPVGGSLRRYYASNWELSAVRSGAVARELMDEYDVAPERITIAGRGPIAPIADNDTPEGRDANRRIVIRILPPAALGEDTSGVTWQ